jgi:hypothetical protein
MFCPECGNQNPDAARFCMKCGYNYSQPTYSLNSSQILPSQKNSVTKNTAKSISILSVLLLLGFFGILAFAGFQIFALQQSSTNYKRQSFGNFSNTSSQPNYSSQSDSPPPQSEPQSHRIVNQAFSLKAGQFSSYKFTIPKSSGSGTVSGNFVASGGSDDIFVVITNETGLTNLKSGNNFKAYYDSGKVTTDNINVNLAPGTYYIVFSNAHSMLTPKAVNADINFSY